MATYAGFPEFCAATRQAGDMCFDDYACEPRAGTPALTMRHVLTMTSNGTRGARFLYNPPAYSWASRPMAEVTGTPFSALVEDLVFHPAGMHRSRGSTGGCRSAPTWPRRSPRRPTWTRRTP